MKYVRSNLRIVTQFSSVAQLFLTPCDPMDCSMPAFPVHDQLPEFTQTHVHWVGDAIQPSHPLLSASPPAFNLSQHQGLFKWVSSSHQVAKGLEFQLQQQSFQWVFRTDFSKDWLVGSPSSPRDSQESSPTPQFKSINSSALSFLYSPTLHAYMTTGKIIALTRWTFVGKVMSLLFNMLSSLIIAFLARSKSLLISWLQWPSTVFLEPPKIKSVTIYIVSPSSCHEVVGPNAMILVFWMLSFKPTFSLSSFTFIRGSLVPLHFLPQGWCHLLTWGYWYFFWKSWFQLVPHPACASSSLAFPMLYSADSWISRVTTGSLDILLSRFEPSVVPCPVEKHSVVPCPFLTVASWPTYRFLRRQVRWSGITK